MGIQKWMFSWVLSTLSVQLSTPPSVFISSITTYIHAYSQTSIQHTCMDACFQTYVGFLRVTAAFVKLNENLPTLWRPGLESRSAAGTWAGGGRWGGGGCSSVTVRRQVSPGWASVDVRAAARDVCGGGDVKAAGVQETGTRSVRADGSNIWARDDVIDRDDIVADLTVFDVTAPWKKDTGSDWTQYNLVYGLERL